MTRTTKPKHRKAGVKREHSTLDGLPRVLESVAEQSGVGAVIPGRIRVTQSNSPGLKLKLQARTMTGFKIGARSQSLAQEVFVVTSEADSVEERLLALGLVDPR